MPKFQIVKLLKNVVSRKRRFAHDNLRWVAEKHKRKTVALRALDNDLGC